MSTITVDSSHLAWAHPFIQEWFLQNLGEPTEPQRAGWPAILEKKHTLISAPTGSGKTLAAFLTCINDLVCQAEAQQLPQETQVLYISPLKALGNDIQKNLMKPLQGIFKLAAHQGKRLQPIEVAVRSGDTTTYERQKLLKKPPHILVTTPESLYILLTASKSRDSLKSIKTVIVDEIHALADDKRGAHLALSLERLNALTKRSPVRIGLSATQKPLARVAQFLIGNRDLTPAIIDIGHAKDIDLQIEIPKTELSAVASNQQWEEIYDRLAELTQTHQSTLIFANTRRVAERVAHHLQTRLGQEVIAAHHGSLSKKLRLQAEEKLKKGGLKALVATASLELGIDVGEIDLVCQLGSPRSIAVMLQRLGRAGHWQGAVSRARLFATTRDELLECGALSLAISQGALDELIIPEIPLDILAQQIVATCATDDWPVDKLFQLVRLAYPYRTLTREQFDSIITMLSEGLQGARGRYGAYLFHEKISDTLKARRGSRMVAIMNGGAIPENGLFTVLAEPQGIVIGTLDEDFAVESHRGDIILLGSTSWKISRIEGTQGRVIVEDAKGAPPTVPFWRGEAPERTPELSHFLSNLRKAIASQCLEEKSNTLRLAGQNWLIETCKMPAYAAEQAIQYIQEGRALLGEVPTQNLIIAERFFDESGGMQLIIHAPFGARINKAWGLALRKCFCRNFNFELQAAATDNGINIALTEQHSFPLKEVFDFLHPNSVLKILTQAVLQSPLFPTRWRWDACRSLALPRIRNGKKIPPYILRMRAEDLLAAVFPDAAACQDNLAGRDLTVPEHPLVQEALNDCLSEALNADGLLVLLKKITQQEITCLAIDTPTPSVFAHEILNANPYAFLDDAPLEERRARAVSMRQILPSALQQLGKLDPEVIAAVKEQAFLDIRSADELQDAMQSLIVIPKALTKSTWEAFFAALLQEQRGGLMHWQEEEWWFSTDQYQIVSLLYPEAILSGKAVRAHRRMASREEIIAGVVGAWLRHLGPITARQIAQLLGLNREDVEAALHRLENTGLILRGHFQSAIEEEWCDRHLLARIHRLTVAKLRQEIEPVTAQQFFQWLLQWQHVAPETQLSGEQGLLTIIEQLQGFEIPAKAWEKEIFTQRVKDYNAFLLDKLCLMGIVGWGRFSALKDYSEEGKQLNPTSITPITFFLRKQMNLWRHHPEQGSIRSHADSHHPDALKGRFTGLSPIAKQIYDYLQQAGASFFDDIHQGIGHLKTEVEMGLWQLTAAGLISADAFDNLRALIDPKRRLSKKRRLGVRSHYSAGRWAILPLTLPKPGDYYEQIAKVLLKRYGVVFRDLLVREKNLPRWGELLRAFRQLEDRGEVRGGRFVNGFAGEQFALPYAVESLRTFKKKNQRIAINLSALDPLNLTGVILPGARMPAIPGNKVSYEG